MNVVSDTVLDKQGNRLFSTRGEKMTQTEKLDFFLCLCLVALVVCYTPLVLAFRLGSSRYLYIPVAFMFLYIFKKSLEQKQIKILPESLLFTFWFIWTASTAIWFHTQPETGAYTLTSPVFRGPFFGILCLVMFNCFYSAKSERAVFPGLVLGGIFLVIFSHISGELVESVHYVGARLGDLTWNSNEYAYMLLFSVFAATYYSFRCVRLGARIAFVSLIVILTALIVLSGSRKALFGEGVFFLLTLGPKYIRDFIKKPKQIPKIVVIMIAMLGASIYILNNTYIGQRFKKVLEEETTRDIPFERRFAGRGAFYLDAVELTSKYPFLGVGLDNFRYYSQRSPGYAAHSDYVGILTETGLPGFILYSSAYLVVLLRLQRAIALSTSAGERFYCQLLRNGLIVILLVALGRWNYEHIPTYIFIALAGRYAAKVSRILPRSLV